MKTFGKTIILFQIKLNFVILFQIGQQLQYSSTTSNIIELTKKVLFFKSSEQNGFETMRKRYP